MKKSILATLIAIGLVGCSNEKVAPELVYIGALGCNTLGLQFEGVTQKFDWYQDTITLTVNCGQNIQIIINELPKNPQLSAPAKTPSKALKDA